MGWITFHDPQTGWNLTLGDKPRQSREIHPEDDGHPYGDSEFEPMVKKHRPMPVKADAEFSLLGYSAFEKSAMARARDYKRDRDLPHMLPRNDAFEDMPEPVRTGCIVKRLTALEQAQRELCDEGSFAYSPNYHVAVLGALKAERLAYRRITIRRAAE